MRQTSGGPSPLAFLITGVSLALILCSGVSGRQVVSGDLDLNGNAKHDSEDIQTGVSTDCNLNGTVDEADTTLPHFSLAIEQLNAVEQFQNNVFDAEPIDFNQDGLQDLIVLSMTSTNLGGVSLWRNEGGIGLVHVTRIGMPNQRPYVLRVADLNGDGMQDFVASDSSFNQVYVFLAIGAEAFAAPVTLAGPPANNGSTGLDIADLDLDGDPDIVFSTWYPAGLNTFINDGDGTFVPGVSFTTDREPRDIAVADFNGDELPDIAAACEHWSGPYDDGTIALHTNNADGTFSAATLIALPAGGDPYNYRAEARFVELHDINNDGFNDLVASASGSNIVSVYINDGTGAFADSQHLGGWWLETEPRDVTLIDLDDDGWDDLVTGDVDTHSVNVYRNNAGVFESHQNFAAGNYGGVTVAAADFSGDGVQDLVVSNDASRTFSLLLGKGGLNFDGAIQIRPHEFPNNSQLADFTGDGLADFCSVRAPYITGDYTLCVYAGLGDAVFAKAPVETPIGTVGLGYVLTRDLNEDGTPDLLSVTGHCRAYLGNGDGTFATPPIESPIAPFGLRTVTGDINLDGHLDLAWVWPGHPSLLRVSFGDGTGAFSAYTEYTDVKEDEAIGIGDITGDGAPEIFTGHRLGVFSIHPNNGDGTFGARRDITLVDFLGSGSPFNPAIGAIAVADFDGDFNNDVAISAFGVRLFQNPAGDGALPEEPVKVSEYSLSTLVPSDIDLDGDFDLYGRSASAAVLMNPGTGFFDTPIFLPKYDSPARGMIVADANGDGRPDVMIAPENSWSQYLFLNQEPVASDGNANQVPDSCETPAACPGDISGPGGVADGVVDVDDLNMILGLWGQSVHPGAPVDIAGDDGLITVDDLNVVLVHWQTACD